MPLFTYKAVREDGTSINDEAMSGNAEELRQELEGRGYLVLSLEKKRAGGFGSGQAGSKDILLFNQEFATLVKAGLPILQSLEILQKRTGKQGLNAILASVIHDIKGGTALSDAMANHPQFFSPLYTATVRAGEKSGALVDVLKRFIIYHKRMLAVRRKITTALIYPSIVVCFVIAVLLLFVFYIIPNFTEMYSDQASLPRLTTFLISLTHVLTQYLPFIFIGILGAGAGIYYWQRSDAGKAKLDAIKLKLPIIGSLITQYTIAQLTRTLATVLRGGIPLVSALDTTAQAISNKIISNGLIEARKLVTEGITLANAFERTHLAPDMTVRMIEVGESSGDLPQMLEDVADFYEDSADSSIPLLTTLIEVAIIAFLGFIVAFIVISLYLPIFEMGSRLK